MVERTCEQCGKKFNTYASRIKVGLGKYCSRTCADISRRNTIERICNQCGKAFNICISRTKEGCGNFCSRKCYDASRFSTVERICGECGKTFNIYESEIRKGGGKFCSKKCYEDNRGTSIHDVLLDLVLCEPSTLETGCWEYSISIFPDGYGRAFIKGSAKLVHKLVYEHFRGPVPDGMHLHHRCENKFCANFEHLEILSPLEHIHKHANNIVAQNALKTHCAHGHEFTQANTYIRADGTGRSCIMCASEANAKYRRKKALRDNPPTEP